MQLTFSRLAALTLAGCAFLAPSADAARAYNDGDILLAIRSAGVPDSSYLYNLGPAVDFLTGTTQLTLDLNMLGDLTSTFGPNWSARSDLFWSVTGVQKSPTETTVGNIMYVSTKRTGSTLGAAGSTSFQSFSTNGAQAPALKLQSMGLRYAVGSTGTSAVESSLNPFGLIQPNSETNAYRSYLPGGPNTVGTTSFGVFSANGGVENTFAAGPGFAGLDFYGIVPQGGAPSYEGSFNIDNNAVVTFTPEGVPEPASVTVLAAGALVLGSIRRRHRVAAR
jgi:hypothetical protein